MLLILPLLLALTPAAGITGIYEVAGAPSDVRLVLHERAGGKIIGYLAGSPNTWIDSGQTFGTSALIHLRGEDGDSTGGWTATLRIRPVGGHYEGTIQVDKTALPITLIPTKASFTEEPWLWVDTTTDAVLDVSRLLDTSGTFLGGGFSGRSSCDFMACGGTLDSWTVTGTSHAMTSISGGGCSQASTLAATFDTTGNQLNGTWSTLDCFGSTSGGNFLGGKAGSTSSKEIEALLSSLADFADDFEAESSDAADIFHSMYLSDGTTRADWVTQFNAWFAAYNLIEVETTAINQLITTVGSDVHPYLSSNPRLTWTVRATGHNTSTGVTEVFWERAEPQVLGPDLFFTGTESGRTVFVGNGEAFPLSIALPLDPADLSTTESPAWPFGVHGGGHATDGHPGIDFTFAAGTADIVAVEAGEITDIRTNRTFAGQVDVIQEIRTGVTVQYGHISDPATVSIGDILMVGDVIGQPGDTSSTGGSPHYVLHFALSFGGASDPCPVSWFNATAATQWDTIFALTHCSEEFCEPLECNDRDAAPPYTATWDLETAGTSSGPDSIYFYRADGYAHDYDYTFFDSSGIAYESGSTSWASSPSTIGLHFTANGTATITYAAADIINDELTLKLNTTSMPTNMTGAATYRYQL